jgi:cytochrome c5
LTSERPACVEGSVADIRSRWKPLRWGALFAVALTLSVIAAPPRALVAQSSTPQHPPPPAYTPPPPGANLDAIGAKRLPEGPGKAIVEASCKDCHSFDRITMAHHSLARWRVIVREMEQRGANVDPGDVDPLAHYLADHFGVRHSVDKPPTSPAGHPQSQ